MRSTTLPCFAALFLLLLLSPVVAGAARPVVLFDQAHAEQFLAQGEDERARLLATSSERSWGDLNGNRKLDQGDAVQPFGIIALVKQGGGEVLVFGDDALFQNRYLIGGNLNLGENLAKRLKP